jgi:hypothetical protein
MTTSSNSFPAEFYTSKLNEMSVSASYRSSDRFECKWTTVPSSPPATSEFKRKFHCAMDICEDLINLIRLYFNSLSSLADHRNRLVESFGHWIEILDHRDPVPFGSRHLSIIRFKWCARRWTSLLLSVH